jgi:hypothetical protein
MVYKICGQWFHEYCEREFVGGVMLVECMCVGGGGSDGDALPHCPIVISRCFQ